MPDLFRSQGLCGSELWKHAGCKSSLGSAGSQFHMPPNSVWHAIFPAKKASVNRGDGRAIRPRRLPVIACAIPKIAQAETETSGIRQILAGAGGLCQDTRGLARNGCRRRRSSRGARAASNRSRTLSHDRGIHIARSGRKCRGGRCRQNFRRGRPCHRGRPDRHGARNRQGGRRPAMPARRARGGHSRQGRRQGQGRRPAYDHRGGRRLGGIGRGGAGRASVLRAAARAGGAEGRARGAAGSRSSCSGRRASAAAFFSASSRRFY